MKTIVLSKELSLPLDAVTQKLAWLGRTGSGKTFGCKRMVEEMLRAGAQVVILDPQGVWAGLRLGPKAFDIPVLGGLFGDIPLEPMAGAMIADLVVDHGTSIVLDVSQMIDADLARFGAGFAGRFFQRKKASPSAVHLVVEECQDFIPQNHQPGEQRMLHEFHRLAKQGRSLGIGMSFLSQRPQEVNKKALNQVECVLAFQMTGPQERKALEYWLSDKGFDGKLSDILPRLDVGAPHIWSPQWLKVSKVIHILPIDSRDTSATPKVGEKAFTQSKLKPIDLKAISAAMAETVERAKADDPKALRAEIAALKRAAAQPVKGAQVAPPVPAPKPERIEVPMFDEQAYADLSKEITNSFDAVHAAALDAKRNLHGLLVNYRANQILAVKEAAKARPKPVVAVPSATPVVRAARETPTPQTAASGADERSSQLGNTGLARMLLCLAQAGQEGLTVSQLAMRSHIARRGGTFRTYLAAGKTKGWIVGRADRFVATETGLQALGPYAERSGSPLDAWLQDLGESGATRMLRALVAAGESGLTKEELSAETAITLAGGTFRTYLAKLKTLELAREAGGVVRANEELFE